MLFGRSIHFKTSQPREVVAARLSASVLPVAAIAPFGPVRVSSWIAQHEGKRFVGRFDGARFKLGLLPTRGARLRWRGNVVVIVGSVENDALQACLRPPIFLLAFLAVFVVVVSAALVLSFFGPLKFHLVQVALALSAALPVAWVVWLFRREAAQAEHALRQTVLEA